MLRPCCDLASGLLPPPTSLLLRLHPPAPVGCWGPTRYTVTLHVTMKGRSGLSGDLRLKGHGEISGSAPLWRGGPRPGA